MISHHITLRGTQILTHLDVVLLPLWRVGLMRPAVVVDLSDIVDTVDKVLLFVLDFEKGCDFIKSFVFSLWHFFVGEHPEDRKENTERQERIIF